MAPNTLTPTSQVITSNISNDQLTTTVTTQTGRLITTVPTDIVPQTPSLPPVPVFTPGVAPLSQPAPTGSPDPSIPKETATPPPIVPQVSLASPGATSLRQPASTAKATAVPVFTSSPPSPLAPVASLSTGAPKTPPTTPGTLTSVPSSGIPVPPGTGVTAAPSAATVPGVAAPPGTFLSDGSPFVPAQGSQLTRTVNRMLASVPKTSNMDNQFSTPTPPDLGSIAFQSGARDGFLGAPEALVTFRLTGASAAACLSAGCTSTCQLDDGPAVICGAAGGSAALQDLSEGVHRLTVTTTPAGSDPGPVAVASTFVIVDTVPPVLTLALEIGSTRVSQQLLAAQPSVFLAWNSTDPVPGLLVISEPCPSLTPPAFVVTGGTLRNLQFDPDMRGTTGQTAYTFEVVPFGLGPSLITISAKFGGFQDPAGNPVNITQDATFTIYYDAGRAVPKISRADAGRPSISTDFNVTLLIDFGKPVTGFTSDGIDVTNGTLLGFLPDPASNGQLYLLDFTIDQLATLVVGARETAAIDFAGHPTLASDQFRVTHYVPNPTVTSTLQNAGVTALVVTGVAATVAGPAGFLGAFGNMGIFAASTGLAAPLPPVYITAADSVSFSLFRWTCPFVHVDFFSSSGDPPLGNSTGPFSNATFAGVPPGANLSSKAAAGRRLLSQPDSALTFLLCGSRPSDLKKRLERVASFRRAGGVEVRPGETPAGRRRSLLQAAQNGTGDVNLTVNVTVLASAVPGNASLRELPQEEYASLLADASTVYNFLSGNLPGSSSKALQQLMCAVFWVALIFLVVLLMHGALYRFVRKKDALPDFLVWPALELIVCCIAMLGIVTASVTVIIGGTRWGLVLGSFFLAVAVLFVLWLAYHVLHHVVLNKSVAFVVKDEGDLAAPNDPEESPTSAFGRFSRWFNRTFSNPADGEWEPVHHRQHRFFNARFGVFFDDLVGFPMERAGGGTTFNRHPRFSMAPSMRRRLTMARGAEPSSGPPLERSASADPPSNAEPLPTAAAELRRTKSAAATMTTVGDVAWSPPSTGPDRRPLRAPSLGAQNADPYFAQPLGLERLLSMGLSAAEREPPNNKNDVRQPDLLTGDAYVPVTSVSGDSSSSPAAPEASTSGRLRRSVSFGPVSQVPVLARGDSPGGAGGSRGLLTRPIPEGEIAEIPDAESNPEGTTNPEGTSNQTAGQGSPSASDRGVRDADEVARARGRSPSKQGSMRRAASASRSVARMLTRSLTMTSAAVEDARHKYGGNLSPYYYTVQMLFYLFEGVLLASWPNSEQSWTQVALIFVLKATLTAYMCFFWPFKEARKQFEELANVTCDVISAILAMVLVAMAGAGASGSIVPIGITLIALQVLPVLITVINACIDTFLFMRLQLWPSLKN